MRGWWYPVPKETGGCSVGNRIMKEKECKGACLALTGKLNKKLAPYKFRKGGFKLWGGGKQPGCFIVVKGPWRGACHYNTRTFTRGVPELYQFGSPVCSKTAPLIKNGYLADGTKMQPRGYRGRHTRHRPTRHRPARHRPARNRPARNRPARNRPGRVRGPRVRGRGARTPSVKEFKAAVDAAFLNCGQDNQTLCIGKTEALGGNMR